MVKKYVISDVEGEDILSLLPSNITINNGIITNEDVEIIICGDVLDSTVPFPFTIDDYYIQKKSFNLRNLKLINNNPDKIKYVLGNRDLNKIKCLYLNKLNNDDNNEYINCFNNGNCDLFKQNTEINTLEINTLEINTLEINEQNKMNEQIKEKNLRNLYNNLKKLKLSWKEDIDNWGRFWMDKEAINKDKEKNKDYKNNYEDFFYNRYNQICADSMAAPNLLYTIPYEYLNIKDLNKDKINLNKDYYAFIVLFIFNILLTKEKKNNRLYKFFKNGKLCLYEKYDTNIYLYSHGGITHNMLDKLNDFLTNNNLTFDLSVNKLLGGTKKYTFNTDIDTNIDSKIDKINNLYKDIITKIYSNDNDNDNKNLVIKLLMISAPIQDNYINKISTNYTFNSTLESPILPGYNNLNENTLFNIDGYNIYQFLGHQPYGYGCSFKKYYDFNTTIINLDNSGTYRGRYRTYNNNNDNKIMNYVLIENDNIKLFSDIYIDIEKDIQFFNNKNYITNYNDYVKKFNNSLKLITLFNDNNKIIISNNSNIQENNIINIKIEYNIINYKNDIPITTEVINGYMYYFYNHGCSSIKNKNYYIFTLGRRKENDIAVTFDKILFILNEKDKNELISKMTPPSGGGKLNNQIGGINKYYNKYLKYKMKYLKLKQN